MNVLFISDAARNYSVGGFEPLGIMYLSTPLSQAGHRVDICGATDREIKRHLAGASPDIIAYSITTGAHELFLKINREIKNAHRVFSVFGGPHPTFFPAMIDEEGVDAICVGEGEEAFVELADKLQRGDDITTVRNFHIKRDKTIYRNDVRPLIEDLDSIPFPDRELFYSYPTARSSKMKTFIASRGCMHRCSYCFNHLYNRIYQGKGKVIRFRSPDNVVNEIAQVKERYPLEFVLFHDSSLVFSKEWLKEFSLKFKKQIGLPFNCNIRPDQVAEEEIAYLKDAGCFSIAWAAEAGNDYIRNNVLRRPISKETLLTLAQRLRKYRINFIIQNMLGIPGESLKECLETLNLNIRCRPDYAWVSLLSPYPGTEIYDTSIKMGLLSPTTTQFAETYHVHSPLKLPDKRKIENLQKLFSLIVAFPWLYRMSLILIRLPFSWIYNQARRLHKAYCLRYKIFYYKISFREYLQLSWRVFTSKAG